MKTISSVFVLFFLNWALFAAQEVSTVNRAVPSTGSIPKGYSVGEQTISPNARFAILYPVRGDDKNAELPPNLLVCLNPYSVVTRVGDDYGRAEGERGQPLALWKGNSMVAVWTDRKWGMTDLSIIEIEADRIKRVHPIWRHIRLLFDKDFRERFLKKFPDEKGSGVVFVSQYKGTERIPEFEFKGRKVLLSLFADNKPNLTTGPRWTATLRAAWNLDTGELEKVDFRPGPIELRPDE